MILRFSLIQFFTIYFFRASSESLSIWPIQSLNFPSYFGHSDALAAIENKSTGKTIIAVGVQSQGKVHLMESTSPLGRDGPAEVDLQSKDKLDRKKAAKLELIEANDNFILITQETWKGILAYAIDKETLKFGKMIELTKKSRWFSTMDNKLYYTDDDEHHINEKSAALIEQEINLME